MAFYGLKFRPGDRLLAATAEYASNLIALLQVARETGAVIEVSTTTSPDRFRWPTCDVGSATARAH